MKKLKAFLLCVTVLGLSFVGCDQVEKFKMRYVDEQPLACINAIERCEDDCHVQFGNRPHALDDCKSACRHVGTHLRPCKGYQEMNLICDDPNSPLCRVEMRKGPLE